MRRNEMARWIVGPFLAAVLLLVGAREARAHCDTMSGPVIVAAQSALESGNVNLVLIWVQPGDEAAIREEFVRARNARAAGGSAREAADQRFFEALVRTHRAGEGAPYTGIKPAGIDIGPAVTAADASLVVGSVDQVETVLTKAVQSGVERTFRAAMNAKGFGPDDVAAGRAYVKAYVEYTHFAEGLYDKATASVAHHEHAAPAHGAEHDGHVSVGAEAHAGHTSHAAHLLSILAIVLGLGLAVETGWIIRLRRRS